ncbi:hypothetical protein [Enterococcus xiangfangensis]|uniref:Uncharacterized protein n=1 Tax=Enterococcus xiangfangensis TaxID=1296537 RepID=A0ABU3FBM7_9ENTE|nr:hypothetical protein [Enterococcus xiangfangensis]MBM7712010.1 hypothetical protein [Enterococcus xiangfangensis]MDT2760078.1 hypothetical protein [Enterococcus xiangfangensis]
MMWKEVIRQKTIQNTILRNGLRLLRQKSWYQSQDKQTVLDISSKLQNVMQLHLETENLVVGIPGFGKEVTLFEIDEPQFVPHYQVEQVIESAAGHFIKLKTI